MATESDEDAATIQGPAPGGVALLFIDMINDLSFPGADKLAARAEGIADRLLELRGVADELGAPVIYVNDNFGRWHSDRDRIVALCDSSGNPARAMVRRMAPRSGDFFVVKPRFSGFYATNLPVLLPKLGATRLVLGGIAADICVLFTAADAHMREYELWVPSDIVASETDERARWALEIMRTSMGAETRPTSELSLPSWIAAAA